MWDKFKSIHLIGDTMDTQQINLINKASQKFNLNTQLSDFNPNILYLTLNRSLVGEIELDSETIYPLYNGDNLLLMTAETIVEIKQTLEELKQAEKIEQVSQNLKVKDLVTNYPDFLGDYDVICNTSYVTQFADVYRVLAVTMVGIYTDIICTPNYQYVMLGNESYSETVKRMELHSEMRQVERVLSVA